MRAVLAELSAPGRRHHAGPAAELAAKAYARTAAYDAAISNGSPSKLAIRRRPFRAFGGALGAAAALWREPAPERRLLSRRRASRFGVATARQLQGKELSYNNINDTDAAYECVAEFDPARVAACVIVKHANPCGVAEGATLADAYRKALACDPSSAFGGIIAFNRPLDADTARAVKIFTEVIIAPDASDEAVALIGAKKNLRLLVTGGLPDPRAAGHDDQVRRRRMLVQSRDNAVVDDDAAEGRDQARADRRPNSTICSSPSGSPSM